MACPTSQPKTRFSYFLENILGNLMCETSLTREVSRNILFLVGKVGKVGISIDCKGKKQVQPPSQPLKTPNLGG